MKINIIAMAAIMLAALTACNDDDDPVIARYLDIERQLPVYYVLNDNNTLIDTDVITDDEAVVLNSVDEVRNYVGDEFLQAYPSYGEVDFTQYSLIVKTSPRFAYVIDTSESEFTIIYNPYREGWQFTEEIYVNDTLENDWYVERVALVVEKIDSDSQISISYRTKTHANES